MNANINSHQLKEPEDDKKRFWIKMISIYHTFLLLVSSWVSLAVAYPEFCLPNIISANVLQLKNVILCVCFGTIGGTLNASRQVIKAVKENDYELNRRLWQILTPLHSGIFAVISIAFIKSGLIMAAGVSTGPPIGPNYLYFITITSFLVGFSTEVFTKRLIGATEALFGEKNKISKIGHKKGKKKKIPAGDSENTNDHADEGN